MWSVLTGQRSGKRWKKVRNKCDPNRRRPACNDERWPASLGKRRGVWNVRRNLRKASRTISGDSQDLTLHTMLPDGVTTVRQTLGRVLSVIACFEQLKETDAVNGLNSFT